MKTVQNLTWENFANSYNDIAVKEQNLTVRKYSDSVHFILMDNAGKRGKRCEKYSIQSWNEAAVIMNLLISVDFKLRDLIPMMKQVDKWNWIIPFEGENVKAFKDEVIATRVINPMDNPNDKYKNVVPRVTENLEVGTIVSSSWGYDQTNIDFHCIVEMSATTVKLLPVNSKLGEETGFMTNTVSAGSIDLGANISMKRYKEGAKGFGSPNGHGWCTPWDGNPETESHYA